MVKFIKKVASRNENEATNIRNLAQAVKCYSYKQENMDSISKNTLKNKTKQRQCQMLCSCSPRAGEEETCNSLVFDGQ